MAILKLISSGKKKIIDRRSKKGGICYKAKCEICGTIFYPSRSDAMYCSASCVQKAVRDRKAEKKTKKVLPAKKKSSK